MSIKIGFRIAAGFGVMLLIIGAISGLGLWALKETRTAIAVFNQTSQSSAVAADLSEAVLMTRLSVRELLTDTSAKVQEKAQKNIDNLTIALEKAPPSEKTSALKAEVDKYKQAYPSLAKTLTERQAILDTSLSVTGPHIEGDLTTLINAASTTGQTEVVRLGGESRRQLLLGRVMVLKYFIDQKDETFETAISHVTQSKKAIYEIAGKSSDAEATKELIEHINEYEQSLLSLGKTTKNFSQILSSTMLPAGINILNGAQAMRMDANNAQTSLGNATVRQASISQSMLMFASAAALFLGIFLAFVIGRSISKPITAMTQTMHHLANGDFGVHIGYLNRHDEIGEMAKAVEIFKKNAIENSEMTAEKERAEEKQRQRTQRLEALFKSFDSSVNAVVEAVSAAATEMEATARTMTATAEETADQAVIVAAASNQASANVQTVAAAADELSTSISEISRQVTESNRIATKAVEDARRTDSIVRGLSDAAQRIGDVVSLIASIAGQTNLLALNATIEAARAGDAGKGFAVVAGEVKTLASQTAKATEEIASQVGAIQGATDDAVRAIRDIGRTIEQINNIAAAIAAAIEEQGAATQEIARNVQEAAHGTEEVTSTITGVKQAASLTGDSAVQVLSASSELARHSTALSQQVGSFLSDVKVA